MWHSFARFLARIFCMAFFGIRVYGQRNVPRRGAVILASTHQSFLDPLLVQVGLSRLAWIMARQSLFRNPLFGRLIRSLQAFPIERGTADLSALHEAMDRLREGNLLLLFPEATRTTDGSIRKLQPGIGIIAHRSNAPVVPVTIDGAFECWPKGRRLFRPGKIRVMYGRPMRLESGDREAQKRFLAELQQQLVEMQDELRRIRKL